MLQHSVQSRRCVVAAPSLRALAPGAGGLAGELWALAGSSCEGRCGPGFALGAKVPEHGQHLEDAAWKLPTKRSKEGEEGATAGHSRTPLAEGALLIPSCHHRPSGAHIPWTWWQPLTLLTTPTCPPGPAMASSASRPPPSLALKLCAPHTPVAPSQQATLFQGFPQLGKSD